MVLIRVAHLQIVAEDIVVAYLQRLDAGLFGLALLQLQQIVLARVGDAAQLVKLAVHALTDDAALLHLQRRVVLYFAGDAVAQGLAEREALPYPTQSGGGSWRFSIGNGGGTRR